VQLLGIYSFFVFKILTPSPKNNSKSITFIYFTSFLHQKPSKEWLYIKLITNSMILESMFSSEEKKSVTVNKSKQIEIEEVHYVKKEGGNLNPPKFS